MQLEAVQTVLAYTVLISQLKMSTFLVNVLYHQAKM